ncbi:hypothetical protein ALCH109712_07365 [Alkalicoccus chagannorensis]
MPAAPGFQQGLSSSPSSPLPGKKGFSDGADPVGVVAFCSGTPKSRIPFSFSRTAYGQSATGDAYSSLKTKASCTGGAHGRYSFRTSASIVPVLHGDKIASSVPVKKMARPHRWHTRFPVGSTVIYSVRRLFRTERVPLHAIRDVLPTPRATPSSYCIKTYTFLSPNKSAERLLVGTACGVAACFSREERGLLSSRAAHEAAVTLYENLYILILQKRAAFQLPRYVL